MRIQQPSQFYSRHVGKHLPLVLLFHYIQSIAPAIMRGFSGVRENEAGQMSLGTSGTGRPVSVLQLFLAAMTMTTPN